MQITLIIVLLTSQATGISWSLVNDLLIYAVLATTIASGAHYIWIWGVMKEIEPASSSRSARD
jgi:cardiolipin synthase